MTTTTHEERRQDAITKAIEVTKHLGELGVLVEVIGSLAKGGFHLDSDIDFLVRECPRSLVYGIEGMVEDIVHPFDFDVVYYEEIQESRRHRFIDGAVSAYKLAK